MTPLSTEERAFMEEYARLCMKHGMRFTEGCNGFTLVGLPLGLKRLAIVSEDIGGERIVYLEEVK